MSRRVRTIDRRRALHVVLALIGCLLALAMVDATRAEVPQRLVQAFPDDGSDYFPESKSKDKAWGAGTSIQRGPVIEKGTGKFVAPEGAAGSANPIQFSGGKVQLNFVDTKIQEFVRAVFEDILRKNYIIDPALKGKVTVRTSREVPKAEVYSILSKVLRMNGGHVSREGALYRVARTGGAGGGGLTGRLGENIRIVPLSFVAAAQAEEALKPFVGANVRIQANPKGRYLLLAGAPQELDNLEQVIGVFDVDQLKGMSLGLIPLREADAGSVSEELKRVFESVQEDGLALRFLPITRMNAILVISPQAAYLDKARRWIGRLDHADREQRKIYVYAVQNRRAGDIADVLNKLFGKGGEETPQSRTVGPGLSERTLRTPPAAAAESNLPVFRRRQGGAAETRPYAGRAQLGRTGPLATPHGRNRSPATPTGSSEVSGAQNGLKITADRATNALLIHATPDEYKVVLSALRRIDTVPLQVLIEATIAEVTLNDQLRFGVRWFLEKGSSQISYTDNPVGLISETFPGFNYFLSAPKIKVVLSALEEVTDLDIVSSPSLTVLDNETAELQVGDQVPIAKRSAVSVTDPEAPVVNDIEFRDTGIILAVTPRVNASGLVVLDITQEVSDVVATTTSGIDSPTIRQRRINSSVAVRSGTAIVLGGLISKKREKSVVGVPLLMHIPKVGHLFKRTTTSKGRTELLVIIRPSVIRNQDDVKSITRELSQKILGLPGPDASFGTYKK